MTESTVKVTVKQTVTGLIYSSPEKDFSKHGVGEIMSDGKIKLYMITTSIPELKDMEGTKLLSIHDALRNFGSYKEIKDEKNYGIGVMTSFVTEFMWENIKKLA